jgi:hypothetical protein
MSGFSSVSSRLRAKTYVHRDKDAINAISIRSDLKSKIKSSKIESSGKHQKKLRAKSPIIAYLNKHKIEAFQLDKDKLKSVDFVNGGVNKDVNRELGILKAKTLVAKQDFQIESQLGFYSAKKDKLREVISLQEAYENNTYASYQVYDKDKIKTHELNNYLNSTKELSLKRKKDLACNIIDIAKIMYMNNVSHGDLHMDNLIIHEKVGGGPKGPIHVQAIDFGRSSFGDKFKTHEYDDIQYLFGKKGHGFCETTARNNFVPFMAGLGHEKSQGIQAKHSPLHKIIKHNTKIGSTRAPLQEIGRDLIFKLKTAGDNENAVKEAFEEAKDLVCNIIKARDLYS